MVDWSAVKAILKTVAVVVGATIAVLYVWYSVDQRARCRRLLGEARGMQDSIVIGVLEDCHASRATIWKEGHKWRD